MDITKVRARVTEISGNTHDPEEAHAAEDALHQDVLAAIAEGAPNAAALAAEALRTRELEFPRWCA